MEIEHQSMGNVQTDYYEQLALFYSKWQNALPCSIGMDLSLEIQMWISNILGEYQKVVRRNLVLENSKSYRLGRVMLSPLIQIKNKYGK